MPSPDPLDLGRYRPLLRILARRLNLDPRLRVRADESDLVHEALLRAHARLEDFRGRSEAEMIGWLQRILTNVFVDELRKAHARKQDVNLEQSLQAAVADSSARLEKFLADDQASPSRQAERKELLLKLAESLEQLPGDQRDVVIQRDLLGASVAEIAEQLGRSEKSVAGLLLRGRRKLRDYLRDYE